MRTRKLLLLVFPVFWLLSPAAQSESIADSSTVFVSEIKVIGPPLLTEEEIESATSPLRNRLVAFDELLALRRTLTELVIDNGYLSSGVVIPDQEVRKYCWRQNESSLSGISNRIDA